MRHFKRKISLESFKSRVPLLINSFDNNGQYINFKERIDDTPIERLYNEFYDGNYGMIPCDIRICWSDNITIDDVSIEKTYSDIEDEIVTKTTNFCNTADILGYCILDKVYHFEPHKWFKTIDNSYFTASYKTLRDMYYFFLKYDNLLNENAHRKKIEGDCEFVLSSATEYYKIYIKNDSFYDEYEEMDKLYYSFGGDIMKDFLYENIFKKFIIPKKHIDNWKSSFLWFMDASKWYKWFDDRYKIYSSLASANDCLKLEDCCDCEEYFRMGGNEMHDLLEEYLTKSKIFNYIPDKENTSIDFHILINNSIDDMGEFSIFSNEWEGGETYEIGDVVNYNNEVYLKTVGKTNDFDDNFKEFVFDSENWEKYFNLKYENPFSSYTQYAYDANNNIHKTETEIDPHEMSIKYPILEKDYILYNNSIFEVKDIEVLNYHIHNKEITLIVKKDDNLRRYVVYNGKRYYGYYKNYTFVFDLLKSCNYREDTEVQPTIKKSVEIDGVLYLFEDGKTCINIKNNFYTLIKEYCIINGNWCHIINNKLVNVYPSSSETENNISDNEYYGKYLTDNITNISSGYTISEGNVNIFTPYEIYYYGKLTGSTSSKLSMFYDEPSVDGLGKTLQGTFKVTTTITYAHPLENSILDLLYHVGNVSDLQPIKIESGETICFGNILTDIEFYYVDIDDNIVTYDKLPSGFISSKEYSGNNLSAIEALKKLNDDYHSVENPILDKEEYQYNDELRVKFTYHLGAMLIKKSGETEYNIYTDNIHDNYFKGVKYVEHYKLSKKSETYAITKAMVYNVYYYSLEPIEYTESVYTTQGASPIITKKPLSNFEIFINNKIEGEEEELTYSNTKSLIEAPIFREEYKFGTASLQKVKDNVYIDRGITKAIDKMLKLTEITTFEDLEQYGNNYFDVKES